jgi:hypothetical protein
MEGKAMGIIVCCPSKLDADWFRVLWRYGI